MMCSFRELYADENIIMVLFSQLKINLFYIQSVAGALQNVMVWGVICIYVSVVVRTWRVTILIHPTAAFLLKLGHQLCGVMHDGSDAAVWLAASHCEGEKKKTSWKVTGSYVISATGQSLLSLLNMSSFEMRAKQRRHNYLW